MSQNLLSVAVLIGAVRVKIESPFVNPVVSCGLPTNFGINVTNVRKV